ncbi:putative holin-like toxin [Staphylococcus pasteuri]|nr:putative holin-like toxin [Staphylococcus pasteuri]
MISIVDALSLMIGFGTFIVTLIEVMVTIIKINHKK